MQLPSLFSDGATAALTIAVITAIATLVSVIVSVLTVLVSERVARVGRIDTNTWEMYRAYNSDAVRRGRTTAREIAKGNPNGFTNEDAYYGYFTPDNLPPNYVLPEGVSRQHMQQLREQSMHDLMAFYNQVGLMLRKRELDRDFTLLLIGGGLKDRWDVLGTLPGLWENKTDLPYGGMFILYKRYLDWNRRTFPKIRRRIDRARRAIQQADSIPVRQ